MNVERRRAARLNSREGVWKRATSMVQALGVAGIAALTTLAAPARAGTGDTFLTKINEMRVQGVTCPEIRYGPYEDGHYETDPPEVMAAASALIRNATLDQAAQAFAAAPIPDAEPQFVGPTGYLPFRAGSGLGQSQDVSEVTLASDQTSNPPGCRQIFSSKYSEIGVAIRQSGSWTQVFYIVAEPFSPQKVPDYARVIFEDINRVRRAGVTCFGKTYPRKAAFIWSDGLAYAAQKHSSYIANNYVDGDPHSDGTADPKPWQTRVNAVPCANNGVQENVQLNASQSPAESWTTLSPGHCQNLMSDRTHAGVGISTAPHLASSLWGRSPFVTLDITNVTGACAAPVPVPRGCPPPHRFKPHPRVAEC
jgi:uncharacterized protein YkwD